MNALANLSPETDKISVLAFWTNNGKKHKRKAQIYNYPEFIWDRRVWPIDRRIIKSRIGGRRKTDISEPTEVIPEEILSIIENYPWSAFKYGNSHTQCIEIRPTPTCNWVYRLYWTIEEIKWSIKYVLESIEKHTTKKILNNYYNSTFSWWLILSHKIAITSNLA